MKTITQAAARAFFQKTPNFSVETKTDLEKLLVANTLAHLFGIPNSYSDGSIKDVDVQDFRFVAITDRVTGNTIPYNLNFASIEELFEAMSPDPVTVQLNDKYKAEITRDGVTVGCQTFPLSKIDELVAAKNKVINEN